MSTIGNYTDHSPNVVHQDTSQSAGGGVLSAIAALFIGIFSLISSLFSFGSNTPTTADYNDRIDGEVRGEARRPAEKAARVARVESRSGRSSDSSSSSRSRGSRSTASSSLDQSQLRRRKKHRRSRSSEQTGTTSTSSSPTTSRSASPVRTDHDIAMGHAEKANSEMQAKIDRLDSVGLISTQEHQQLVEWTLDLSRWMHEKLNDDGAKQAVQGTYGTLIGRLEARADFLRLHQAATDRREVLSYLQGIKPGQDPDQWTGFLGIFEAEVRRFEILDTTVEGSRAYIDNYASIGFVILNEVNRITGNQTSRKTAEISGRVEQVGTRAPKVRKKVDLAQGDHILKQIAGAVSGQDSRKAGLMAQSAGYMSQLAGVVASRKKDE